MDAVTSPGGQTDVVHSTISEMIGINMTGGKMDNKGEVNISQSSGDKSSGGRMTGVQSDGGEMNNHDQLNITQSR